MRLQLIKDLVEHTVMSAKFFLFFINVMFAWLLIDHPCHAARESAANANRRFYGRPLFTGYLIIFFQNDSFFFSAWLHSSYKFVFIQAVSSRRYSWRWRRNHGAQQETIVGWLRPHEVWQTRPIRRLWPHEIRKESRLSSQSRLAMMGLSFAQINFLY